MKRAIWIGLLAVLAFAVILVIRFPARWAAAFLPDGITCARINGTVWHGMCGGLVVNGTNAGDLTWQLRPATLLRGRLASRVDLTYPQGFAQADVEMGRDGNIVAENLRAKIALNPALLPQLPNITGDVQLDLPRLRAENSIITEIQGRLEAHNLQQRGSPPMPVGDYALTFPVAQSGSEPIGQLQSLSGPLDVRGTVRLTRVPGVFVEGTVAARADTPQPLRRQLEYLGSPDAQGRRPFSLEFSF